MAAAEPITARSLADSTIAVVRATSTSAGTADGYRPQDGATVRIVKDSPASEKKEEKNVSPITIDSLYPAPDILSPAFGTALRLLAESLQRAAEAVIAADEEDRIAADNAVIRIQALLPELFCCRSLGDGFGHLINAIFYGIKNRAGTFLNAVQIRSIKRALEAVRSQPFMSFEVADGYVDYLEDAGLDTEPSTFRGLKELLDEEGIR
jgi:hypothetical protein